MSHDKSLVFIVSGGRTGTAFFGERLSRVIEGAYSEHEPDLFAGFNRKSLARIRAFGWWHLVFGRLLGVSGLRSVGTRYLQGSLSAGDCRRRIETFRERYHAQFNAPIIIESNAQWWYLVDQIQRVWPRAKVIAIIRDPRTWIRSWINKGDRYTWKDRALWLPPGRLTPAKLRESGWAARWSSLGVFGKLAWEWQAVYSRLDAHVASNDLSRMFRFEDLFSGSGDALGELVEFAATHEAVRSPLGNLQRFTDDVRNASTGSASDWPDWTRSQALLLDELCGPLMKRFGYGSEPEWSALLGH